MALESIALIPSGVKATKVYSQLPVNGNGDFTFDRGTSADQTRVNKNGLIESVAQDVPRLDYLDGGCPSLLLEPASTNLYDYSEDLNLWNNGLVGLSISADSSLSPDGSVNADLVTEDTSTGAHVIRRTTGPTTTSGLDYSFSFFIKANGRDIVGLSNNVGTASATAFFNLTSGTILSSTFDSAFMVDYGNGWWRIETTHEATGTGDYEGRIYTAVEDNFTFSHTGDGVSGFYIWGLQVEQQSYATSYIPTSGATATRNAETCNGAGTTAEINSQEGVLFVEIRALADSLTFRAISLSDGSSSDRVFMYYSTTSNRLTFSVDVSSSNEFFLNQDFIDITQQTKIAFQYKQNDFKVYVNGLLIGVGLSGNVPSSGVLTELAFDDGSGSPFYGRVKKLSVYKDTTTDLEKLTGFTSFAEMSSYLSYS
jgi:hypothetical protein